MADGMKKKTKRTTSQVKTSGPPMAIAPMVSTTTMAEIAEQHRVEAAELTAQLGRLLRRVRAVGWTRGSSHDLVSVGAAGKPAAGPRQPLPNALAGSDGTVGMAALRRVTREAEPAVRTT